MVAGLGDSIGGCLKITAQDDPLRRALVEIIKLLSEGGTAPVVVMEQCRLLAQQALASTKVTARWKGLKLLIPEEW